MYLLKGLKISNLNISPKYGSGKQDRELSRQFPFCLGEKKEQMDGKQIEQTANSD